MGHLDKYLSFCGPKHLNIYILIYVTEGSCYTRFRIVNVWGTCTRLFGVARMNIRYQENLPVYHTVHINIWRESMANSFPAKIAPCYTELNDNLTQYNMLQTHCRLRFKKRLKW